VSIELAAEVLGSARSGLAVTGAGVSAESGIPTFRGEGGLWTKYDPVKVSSIDSFLADPASYWQVSKERGSLALAAKPNPGHIALARLEAAGRLAAIVTQNTDGLHQAAGSKRVIELHGSGRMVECLECGRREPRSDVQARLDFEMPPRCQSCGGAVLKPTVVLFGEAMPAAAAEEAYELASQADVVLVVGTSLAVYPAADVPLAALRAGALMVVVNAEATPFDRIANVVIRGRSGEVLPQIADLIGG
jgi:NAD-dependent protein deacetylase/lipoamidase